MPLFAHNRQRSSSNEQIRTGFGFAAALIQLILVSVENPLDFRSWARPIGRTVDADVDVKPLVERNLIFPSHIAVGTSFNPAK